MKWVVKSNLNRGRQGDACAPGSREHLVEARGGIGATAASTVKPLFKEAVREPVGTVILRAPVAAAGAIVRVSQGSGSTRGVGYCQHTGRALRSAGDADVGATARNSLPLHKSGV